MDRDDGKKSQRYSVFNPVYVRLGSLLSIAVLITACSGVNNFVSQPTLQDALAGKQINTANPAPTMPATAKTAPLATASTKSVASSISGNIGNIVTNVIKQGTASRYMSISFKGHPVEIYTKIGRLVHRCWLHPTANLLHGQFYYAETTREKTPSALISLHHKAALGRRGRITFSMQMQKSGNNTSLYAVNYKLPAHMAQFLVKDISRWSQNDLTCHQYQPPASHTVTSIPSNIPLPTKK